MDGWYDRLTNAMRYIGTPLVVVMTALTVPLARAVRWRDKKGVLYALITTGATVATLGVVNYYKVGLDIVKRGVHCSVDIVHDTPAISMLYYSVLNGFWAGISVVWRIIAVDNFYKNVIGRNPEGYITKRELNNLVKAAYSLEKEEEIPEDKLEEAERVKFSIKKMYLAITEISGEKSDRKILEADNLKQDLFGEKTFSKAIKRTQAGDFLYFLSFCETYVKNCGDNIPDGKRNMENLIAKLWGVYNTNNKRGLLTQDNNRLTTINLLTSNPHKKTIERLRENNKLTQMFSDMKEINDKMESADQREANIPEEKAANQASEISISEVRENNRSPNSEERKLHSPVQRTLTQITVETIDENGRRRVRGSGYRHNSNSAGSVIQVSPAAVSRRLK